MIQHIVMWKFKERAQDNTKEKNIALVKEMLEALPAKISELISLKVEVDVALKEGNYDAVLITEFADYEALHHYTAHPAHQKVGSFIFLVTQARASVDYDIN